MPLAVSPNPGLPEAGGGGLRVTTGWETALCLGAAEAKANSGLCDTLFCCLDSVRGGSWICPLTSRPTTPQPCCADLSWDHSLDSETNTRGREGLEIQGGEQRHSLTLVKTTNPPAHNA